MTPIPSINLVQGPWWDSTAHLVYLAWDVAVSPEFQERVARGLYARAVAFGNVCLCTKRPNRYPAAYAELRVVPSLRYTRWVYTQDAQGRQVVHDEFPPAGVAAMAFGRVLIDDRNWWRPAQAFASWEAHAHTPEAMAAALFHEWGHLYGWGGDHPGGDQPDNPHPLALPTIRRNVPLAAAIAARYHRKAEQ